MEAAQLPETPPSPRPLYKTVLYFLCMILFLVFADWFNTNDVTIRMSDGVTISAKIRYDTQNHLDIQEYQPDGHLSTETRRLSKEQIASIEPVPSFTQTVHGMKWYLAGTMGLLVLLMVSASWAVMDLL